MFPPSSPAALRSHDSNRLRTLGRSGRAPPILFRAGLGWMSPPPLYNRVSLATESAPFTPQLRRQMQVDA